MTRAFIAAFCWFATWGWSVELRVPLAVELTENRETLVVGCKDGSLVSIDAKRGRIQQVLETSGSITDLAKLDDEQILATDFGRGRLIRLKVSGGRLQIVEEVDVTDHPVSVSVDRWNGRIYVAGKWSKQLVALQVSNQLRVLKTTQLPFVPREQILIENGERLVVGDAHGGKLALLNTASLGLESVRQLPGHNIRGMALNLEKDYLFVSHQRLNPLARTSFDDIHWGMAVSNVVRAIPIASLVDSRKKLPESSQVWNLGTVGHGAGDPDEMVVLRDGKIVVAIAGTGHVFHGSFGRTEMSRIETGARPAALTADEFGERLYVANELDDLISVIDLRSGRIVATVNLAPPNLMISAADRGARLFFNARLSHDGWFSCHSCHTNGHSNGLSADTFGDGSFGSPKLVPSLLGNAKTAPFGWLGNQATLHNQVRSSLETTMQHRGQSFARDEIADLTAFLESLPGLPTAEDSPEMKRGRVLFTQLNCSRCHDGEGMTSRDSFDVGVSDEVGNPEFNPPSLRGVGFRERFFHDGRFGSLEAVFQEGKHQIKRKLSDRELTELLTFLRGL